MARSILERTGGVKWCSYKRLTIFICLVNLVVVLYLLCSIRVFSSQSSEHVRRTEESARIRRTLEPVELVRLVKQLSKRFDGERLGWDSDQSVKQKLAGEILQRLSELGPGTNATEQRETVGLWLAEKLKSLKLILLNSTTESSMLAKDANILARALESDRKKFLEDIGLWIPSETNNYEIYDNPENATEFEEDLILGQLLPPECHADPHTDYDGLAVRWGPTHHKATAADCCQACIDQAKHAKPGQMKCNIWVYCPSEFGCYSPDIFEHQYQECWLKQAVEPRLNFKDKYPETYRDAHPKAPVNVPWISGVLS